MGRFYQKEPCMPRVHTLFSRFAERASSLAGSPAAFMAAFAMVVLWALTGPLFGFSDSWQIVINTTTTIITFLLVFLIQHAQNRDTKALQLKLDELIRVTEGAHNALLNLEQLDEDELDSIRQQYATLACKARQAMENGGKDDDAPPLDLTHKPKG